MNSIDNKAILWFTLRVNPISVMEKVCFVGDDGQGKRRIDCAPFSIRFMGQAKMPPHAVCF
jgi:hypothetical protein